MRILSPRSALALTLLAVALTSGCSGSDNATSAAMTSDSFGAPNGKPAVSGPEAPASGAQNADGVAGTTQSGPKAEPPKSGGATASTVGSGGLGNLQLSGASLVVTDALTVAVADVSAAEERVKTIATAHRGGVTAEDTQGGGSDGASGSRSTLTVRVPNDAVDPTERAISALGKRLTITRATNDVTDEVVDVRSRVASARQSLARVQALFARATRLADIVSLEGEVARRSSDLDALLQRQQSLSGLTSMATLTVTLVPPSPVVAPKPKPVTASGFGAGLHSGVRGLRHTTSAVLLVVGAMLPFAVVLAVLLLPVTWVVRRRLRRSTMAKPSAPVAA